MKQLTIYTKRYGQLLKDFAADATNNGLIIRRTDRISGGLFSINCLCNRTGPAFARALMMLLTDIALLENPIYQHSPKLREMAGDLCDTPLYAAAQRDFSHFLRYNRTLHLEGYVTFRMAEYREKLDILSYSLIKKMKLIQQD